MTSLIPFTLNNYITIGNVIKVSIDLTSYLISNLSTSNDFKQTFEQQDLEFLLDIANSIIEQHQNVLETKCSMDSVIIMSKSEIIKGLDSKVLVVYYIQDNIMKINTLLTEIQNKKKSYLFNTSCKQEYNTLSLLIKQLKERILVFNSYTRS